MKGPVLLAAPVQSLRGVGPALTEKLARIGVHTLLDLLLHLPTRYQDRTRVTPLVALPSDAEALVVGEVMETRLNHGRRRSWLVTIGDGTGFLRLRFFHFSERQRNAMAAGMYLRCFGDVRPRPRR